MTIENWGAIARIRFDRKANLNAFNEQLVLKLTHIAKGIHDDLETQAVVLPVEESGFKGNIVVETDLVSVPLPSK